MMVGTEETRLIVVRGNSASGKSSIAAGLRERFGRNLALIGQDNLRRVVLRERDRPGAANIGLIGMTARYALDAGFHTVVEGILYADHYAAMLEDLVRDHRGTSRCMARWLNAWAADFARRTPDCLHTATLHPEPDVETYVREAVEAGARVFKAHVQVGDYDPADGQLQRAWGLLAEAGIPVVVHCGSGPAPGKHTGPEPIARVLARHPRLRLIVAHMGMAEYAEFLDLAERYAEVRLDTTMAFTDFTEGFMPFPRPDLPRLADLGDRILLGSDFPNIPYSYLHQLHALERLGLGQEWLRAVCHDNAANLFGL
ncbi:amidohydrolase family protein [Streptomyces sp. HD]|uniref:amidohydrolase family protein n=1 Tax=Streptomyces sp. HD TaxID=3020892 RepID=UPI00232FC3BD|nr:amidohydrolase family protein [Streptomyces sp. HD]MDC0770879.1 amidohydrolase family protein [Streptomyces sp. HD]